MILNFYLCIYIGVSICHKDIDAHGVSKNVPHTLKLDLKAVKCWNLTQVFRKNKKYS